MENAGIQQQIFHYIKENLSAHKSMVDEISGLLNLKNDSAYRRIRGETPISLEELQILTTSFSIPLDKFLHFQTSSYIFSGQLKPAVDNSLEAWLENILMQLEMFNSYEKKHMYYLVKDIPPFIIFLIPELARFKFFFYMNSILQYKSLRGLRFILNDPAYDKFDLVAKKIAELYLRMPMTEIWNVQNIECTLRQIAFYKDAGSFKNESDVYLLYSKMLELVDHLEIQTEQGVKFNIGKEPTISSSAFRMYINELMPGDNSILVELDNRQLSFLNFGFVFYVYTCDVRFNNSMRGNFDDLIKKSTMISQSGEKERLRFFNKLRERIYHYRNS